MCGDNDNEDRLHHAGCKGTVVYHYHPEKISGPPENCHPDESYYDCDGCHQEIPWDEVIEQAEPCLHCDRYWEPDDLNEDGLCQECAGSDGA